MTHSVPILSNSQARYLMPVRTTPIRVWLIVAGIALSTVMNVIANRAERDPNHFWIGDLLLYRPSPLAATAQRAGLAMILAGGILCAVARAGLRVPRQYRILLCCSIGYSLILAARNLQPRDLLTYSVFSPLAPGCALASCLL